MSDLLRLNFLFIYYYFFAVIFGTIQFSIPNPVINVSKYTIPLSDIFKLPSVTFFTQLQILQSSCCTSTDSLHETISILWIATESMEVLQWLLLRYISINEVYKYLLTNSSSIFFCKKDLESYCFSAKGCIVQLNRIWFSIYYNLPL